MLLEEECSIANHGHEVCSILNQGVPVPLCKYTGIFGNASLRSFDSGQAKFLPEIFILFRGISSLFGIVLKSAAKEPTVDA